MDGSRLVMIVSNLIPTANGITKELPGAIIVTLVTKLKMVSVTGLNANRGNIMEMVFVLMQVLFVTLLTESTANVSLV